MAMVVWLGLALLASGLQADVSWASQPVKRVILGCVVNGNLYSVHKNYSRDPKAPKLVAYLLRVEGLDVTPYEGKRVRVRGLLLPGDRFKADPLSLRVMGPCGEAPRQAIRRLYR